MINLIDLFSGCGGLADGFEQSGFYRTIACVEWEKSPCLTHIARLKNKWNYQNANKIVFQFDIQRTKELIHGWKNDPEYQSNFGIDSLIFKNSKIDVIIGGPPCQAYSIAGRIRDEYGMHKDYRNYLFESYLKIVNHYKPKIILFENVPGILSASPGGVSIIERIKTAFNNSGYEVVNDIRNNALLDLVQFGVPQKRSRVIIVGLLKSHFGALGQRLLSEFYNSILPQYHSRKLFTVKDAIGNLDPFFPAKNDYKIYTKLFSHVPNSSNKLNHIPRYHNRRDIGIFNDLSNDIALNQNKYTSIHSLHELYSKRTGRKSKIHKYYVLRWDEPSNTIPAHLYKDGLRHIHPDPKQSRSLTVREAARLQTFEDNYEFIGSMGDQYKMIGNAVPPLFAKCLAYSIHDLWKKYC